MLITIDKKRPAVLTGDKSPFQFIKESFFTMFSTTPDPDVTFLSLSQHNDSSFNQ